MRKLPLAVVCCVLTLLVVALPTAAKPKIAPFSYIPAEAHHVLPGTHNEESGYRALVEGLDGSLYIGTANNGGSASLVELDPRDGRQIVVADAHKALGAEAEGFAAHAQIATPGFVAPSGKIYFGTRQGYATRDDRWNQVSFTGGHVLTYDPRTQRVENLGLVLTGEGVNDVVADESRSLLYAITTGEQWIACDLRTTQPRVLGEPAQPGKYRKLGVQAAEGVTTLIDASGNASILTADFQLAQHNPQRDRVRTFDILVDNQRLGTSSRRDTRTPLWTLAPDKRSAFLVLADSAEVIQVDLTGEVFGQSPDAVIGKPFGKLIENGHASVQATPAFGPDGLLYAIVRVPNDTDFGDGHLFHLVRLNPDNAQAEDLGVLSVENPAYFAFAPAEKTQRYTRGFHRLPDGTLTPSGTNGALRVGRDGTVYATFLHPFTVLEIGQFRGPLPTEPPPAQQYVAAALDACDKTESQMDEFVRVAELVAQRHIDGGLFGFPWNYQGLQQELMGRSGGMVATGFERPWKPDRTDAEKANDIAIISWDQKPANDPAPPLKALKARGVYIIGFGPRDMPEIAEAIELCDAFFDTGIPPEGRVVKLADGSEAGRMNHYVNAINGWVLTGEIVAALTRMKGMPTMWKSYAYPDGREWGDRYLGKKQFHDDYQVDPIPAGQLGRAFLHQVRYHVRAFANTQLDAVDAAAEKVVAEVNGGKLVYVASSGHMPWTYVGKFEDKRWGKNVDVHSNVADQMETYRRTTPEGALVVRIGYNGEHEDLWKVWDAKNQRVIFIGAENPLPEYQVPRDPETVVGLIDMGFAYGDASVSIEKYPVSILPPSGYMQVIAYESLNVEVLDRLSKEAE